MDKISRIAVTRTRATEPNNALNAVRLLVKNVASQVVLAEAPVIKSNS